MYHCLQTTSHGHPFLLPLCHIREVIVSPPREQTIPANELLPFRTDYRGQTIPIVTARLWDNGDLINTTVTAPGRFLIVCIIYGASLGLDADETGHILHLPTDILLNPSPRLSADSAVLACYPDPSGALIPLLDLHGMLRRLADRIIPEADTDFTDGACRHSAAPDPGQPLSRADLYLTGADLFLPGDKAGDTETIRSANRLVASLLKMPHK
jgi:chemotaxis signal transduction protein